MRKLHVCKSIWLTLALAMCWLFGSGQRVLERPLEDRMETQRIAFITERVDLTPEEAQAFWPIYNAFRKQEKTIRQEKEPAKRPLNMDDQEAAEFVQVLVRTERKLLDLREAFISDISEVLSAKKVLRFHAAERQFKERLLRAIYKKQNR